MNILRKRPAVALAVLSSMTVWSFQSIAADECWAAWESETFFRTMTPQTVRDCVKSGSNPNAPVGGVGAPPLGFVAFLNDDRAVIAALLAARGKTGF